MLLTEESRSLVEGTVIRMYNVDVQDLDIHVVGTMMLHVGRE